MVSAVSSKSAGPGTRQNIDEFTRTTRQALVEIGGAEIGKAIIVLNPAEPPINMRNTVFCALPEGTDHDAVVASIEQMVADVAQYVPGYRLKQPPLIEEGPFHTPGGVVPFRSVVLLEVEGAGDYLPDLRRQPRHHDRRRCPRRRGHRRPPGGDGMTAVQDAATRPHPPATSGSSTRRCATGRTRSPTSTRSTRSCRS